MYAGAAFGARSLKPKPALRYWRNNFISAVCRALSAAPCRALAHACTHVLSWVHSGSTHTRQLPLPCCKAKTALSPSLWSWCISKHLGAPRSSLLHPGACKKLFSSFQVILNLSFPLRWGCKPLPPLALRHLQSSCVCMQMHVCMQSCTMYPQADMCTCVCVPTCAHVSTRHTQCCSQGRGELAGGELFSSLR